MAQPSRCSRAISVSRPRLADVLDPTFESGMVAALRLVDVKRAINPKGRIGPPGRDLPVNTYLVDKLPLAARPQSFLRADPEAWPCRRQSASACCFLPIVLQKSKVASVRIFRET